MRAAGPPVVEINEHAKIDVRGGYLVDGFPSVGLSSAIASESMINTSGFERAGTIDSDQFEPASVVKEGVSDFPARIFANNSLKVAIFLSYLAPEPRMHRAVAGAMISWARRHGVSLVVSAISVGDGGQEGAAAAANSAACAERVEKAGLRLVRAGLIPGIPGALLNEGAQSGQDVAVILHSSSEGGPDYRAGAELCGAMSRLVPGTSCDMEKLRAEAQRVEGAIKESGRKRLTEGMYR